MSFSFEGHREFLRQKDGEDGYAKWAALSEKYGAADDKREKRTKFKHDEDEITYSKSFRRLSHKSQIVVRPESDHFRSRMTHTLEVNQIAESIAYRLGLNIDLVNAIALGHDLGHCPFGHAGEREMQSIVRAILLANKANLCDPQRLAEAIRTTYNTAPLAWEDKDGHPTSSHWLFHHAVNSVRLLSRKMRGIQQQTKDGVLCHSWSPWQHKSKFGVPPTYEAQVVAIADQVAGINHDTEDILGCPESEHSIGEIRQKLPVYFEKQKRTYLEAQEFLAWFLPENATADNGYGRKNRLQCIINEVVTASLVELEREGGASSADAIARPLTLTEGIGKHLDLYESFVRTVVIDGVSWFRHRDAVAEAVIRTAFNLFWHYGRFEKDLAGVPSEVLGDMERRVKEFRESISEPYDDDLYYKAVMSSTLAERSADADRAVRTMDYVTGMTDKRIMDIHSLSLYLFR